MGFYRKSFRIVIHGCLRKVAFMKWLLIDGYNLAFRSFYGMPDLARADGFPTGALHGWVRTLWMIIDQQKPDCVSAFFDLEGAARQTELFADYKANRSEMPEPLRLQMPYVKAITQAMGVPVIERPGVEADDLIGSAACALAEEGHSVIIVSADKDLGQLVNGSIRQLVPPPTANPKLGWREMDAAGIEKRFGVPPEKIPAYLALVGDASDNIPGVPGVGPKTAVKWILEHGTLDAIIEAARQGVLKPPRFQEVVAQMEADLRRNLEMVTLHFDFEPELIGQGTVNLSDLVRLFEELEMKKAANDAQDRYNRLF